MEVKYYARNAAADTRLETMAFVTGCRYRVEEFLEEGKSYLRTQECELQTAAVELAWCSGTAVHDESAKQGKQAEAVEGVLDVGGFVPRAAAEAAVVPFLFLGEGADAVQVEAIEGTKLRECPCSGKR